MDEDEVVICPGCNGEFAAWAKESWKDDKCFRCHDPLSRVYKIEDAIFDDLSAGSFAWIQWKGTNVCMDVHCKKCEAELNWFGHLDADFAYFIKCACGTVYAVDGHVTLIELTPEEVASMGPNPPSLHELSYDEDD